MISRRIHACAAGAIAAVAMLVIISAAGSADRAAALSEAGYQIHVSTDKPIYRGNETVYIRGVMLHADTHQPTDADRSDGGIVQIIGPRGDTVASMYVALQDSVVGCAWQVPGEPAGGKYTVVTQVPGAPKAERSFEVRSYRAPRLRTQISFLREGYGPGDTVNASVEVSRAEGGIPAGAEVTVIARLDDAEVHRATAAVNEAGLATAHFKLPDEIERGDGTLAFVISDSGHVQTATRTLPILLQTVDLGIYPEGGDLVAGLPNRVYIEARTPAQQPADVAGVVVDGNGKTVAEFATTHEGRGRFSFTPQARATYAIRLTAPTGIDRLFELPAVADAGAVIRSTAAVYEALEPITLDVFAPAQADEQQWRVTLSRRDSEVAATRFAPALRAGHEHGDAQVKLTPPDDVHGVLIATVWDADGKPVAERLIYRQPRRQLEIAVTATKSRYVPGDQVELTIQTRDGNGKPVAGVVGLTVTDDSVLEMIQTREQAPGLPVMVLLEPEVRELADAHVYLDRNNADAPAQLDLLLGAQGWRRFAAFDVDAFVAEHGDAGRRALAMASQQSPDDFWIVGGDGHANVDLDGVPLPAAQPGQAVIREGLDIAASDEAPAEAANQPLAEAQLGREAPVARSMRQGRRRLQARDEMMDLDRRARFADAEQIVPVVFREYAHQARPDRQPGDRSDFTETLFWHAGVKTDDDGIAKVSFQLADSVTTFRVSADGFDDQGALGSGETTFESVEPFHISPTLPLEVTAGDEILMPVAVVNATSAMFDAARISVEAPAGVTVGETNAFKLGGDSRTGQSIALRIDERARTGNLILTGEAGSYRDRVTRPLRIVPTGFPVEQSAGGIIGHANPLRVQIVIPDTLVRGSLHTRVAVYPSPIGNMTDAVKSLLREPGGCFEQTSSTTYPMVMAMQYLASDPSVSASIVDDAHGMLERGYQRLIGYESKSGGFEWFGNDPGHLALSAYGLLQFTDMATVRPVDTVMLARTRQWILDQRDGEGGFANTAQALHSWSPDPKVTDAYVVWALLSAGQKPASIELEVQAAKANAVASDNSYVKALGALIAQMTDDRTTARKLMNELAANIDEDGFVGGATTTVVCSGGDALKIETTALAVLAWLGDDAYATQVEEAIRAIATTSRSGRYGSTQSTVLALKAIVQYNAAKGAQDADGNVTLRVNGKTLEKPVAFTSESSAVEFADFADQLGPGKYMIEIHMAGDASMPASVTVGYHDSLPRSSEQCALRLAVVLNDAQLEEGGITEARVTVTNASDAAAPMPIAIIGIPGGMEVRHDQLAELVDAERIAAYEVVGRDLILYWQGLDPRQEVTLPISLVAAIPGRYRAPASRAYLYYTDEHRTWVEGLSVSIRPRP